MGIGHIVVQVIGGVMARDGAFAEQEAKLVFAQLGQSSCLAE
jgi:hypothetical protein